jgi:hypothetical protein
MASPRLTQLRGNLLRTLLLPLVAVVASVSLASASDIIKPADVRNLRVTTSGSDASLTWEEVTLDRAGNQETLDHYNVYSANVPDFTPGSGNLLGTSTTPDFTHTGAAVDGLNHYYTVTAVDAVDEDGTANESNGRPPRVLAPLPRATWTASTIEVEWTGAEPLSEATNYRVYYGTTTQFDFIDDVGLATSHSLTGLDLNLDWYIAVSAEDSRGYESHMSYKLKVMASADRIDVILMEDMKICWGFGSCPRQANEVRRASGQETNMPVWFPQGNWVSATLSWSVESRLCDNVPDKCGDNNPGWNPCGDPWDRTATLYLVEDNCIDAGTGCAFRNDNIELIHAITPFGTDADPPDGSGVVPPRLWTYDVTPLVPVLTGQKHVGVKISTFVRFWWNNVTFQFSKNPADASPEPPADGVVATINHSGGDVTTPRSVTIPSSATQVFMRYFVSGHGGTQRCDGGSEDGQSCAGGCPGGSCQNCDEFCHRTNRILVDGSPVFQTVPWNDCFSKGFCPDWNACGTLSCFFDRAGWCPGFVTCHEDDPCDQDLDATSWLPPGGTYGVTYDLPVRNGSWSKSVTVYWYE